jgi:hypothetical protein
VEVPGTLNPFGFGARKTHFCGQSMLQSDTAGTPLFMHANTAKYAFLDGRPSNQKPKAGGRFKLFETAAGYVTPATEKDRLDLVGRSGVYFSSVEGVGACVRLRGEERSLRLWGFEDMFPGFEDAFWRRLEGVYDILGM